MYQAEIKKRWDNKAQIKDGYAFPRVSEKTLLASQKANANHVSRTTAGR